MTHIQGRREKFSVKASLRFYSLTLIHLSFNPRRTLALTNVLLPAKAFCLLDEHT